MREIVESLAARDREAEDRLTRREASEGLAFFRADKDNDADFDPLTTGAWEAGSPAATGTINWNTTFGVPKRARTVLIYVSGTISFKAKSTTTNGWATTGEQRTAPVANDGTTYWFSASGTVTVRVLGWWA